MIKATNNAVGLEIERRGDIILFTGHLGNRSIDQARIPIWANDAWKILNNTDLTEIYAEQHQGNRCLIGAIDWKPQGKGTEIIFWVKYVVFVDSKEFEQELKKILS